MRTKSVGWVFGLACVAAMGCSGDMADEGVTDERLAIDAGGLHWMCGTLRADLGGFGTRYLDAYTSGNGDVVTRPRETNDTQRWCFKKVPPPTASGGSSGIAGSGGSGGSAGSPAAATYTIQHRSLNGEFLDAYEGSNANKAILRAAQNNDTQLWIVSGTSGGFLLRQKSNGRYLRAGVMKAENYGVFTDAVEATSFAFTP